MAPKYEICGIGSPLGDKAPLSPMVVVVTAPEGGLTGLSAEPGWADGVTEPGSAGAVFASEVDPELDKASGCVGVTAGLDDDGPGAAALLAVLSGGGAVAAT